MAPVMDAHTLELLEYPKIRALVAARASSSLGKERALALEPLADLKVLEESLSLVTEMVDALEARLDPPLGGLKDVRVWLKRAALGVMLELDQLADVRSVLGLADRVRDYTVRLGNDYPRLARRLESVGDFRPQLRAIDEAIDERGRVRDNATDELARVRAEIARLDERIQVELRRLIRAPEVRKALRFAQSTLAGEHHVLPVAVNYRHLVPGVIHRTSSTGETIYVEPAKVAQIAADLAVVRHAELREIRRVLRRISAMLGAVAAPALATIETLGELDFIRAKADYSRAFAMAPPDVTADGPLRLDEVRHPLLLELRRSAAPLDPSPDRDVVPVTVTLGGDYDLLVITGPNTGGKTVALKTVGLACAMALSGLHIAARAGSRVPLLGDILADVGDEQSLEQSLSTFSGHIARIASILRHAGPRTLVLLDELGAGTDPTEGAALGRAILDELVRLQCRGMVTTHLGDLKTYALAATRVENAAVEFDSQSLRPTYRLLVGQFGQSCALKIARRLDLPRALVDRARKYLRRRGKRAPELLRLQQMREQAELARRDAERAQAEAQRAQSEFEKKTDLLEQESSISRELDRFRAGLAAGDLVRVPRLGKDGTVRRVDGKKRVVAVTIGAVEWELGMDEILPIPKTTRANDRDDPRRPAG